MSSCDPDVWPQEGGIATVWDVCSAVNSAVCVRKEKHPKCVMTAILTVAVHCLSTVFSSLVWTKAWLVNKVEDK